MSKRLNNYCIISALLLLCITSATSKGETLKDLSERKSHRANGNVLVCYYYALSNWREDVGKFQASNINPDLCTHVIYSFIGLKEATNKIYSLDPGLDLGPGEIESDPDDADNNKGDLDMIRKTVSLREQNPDLKVLLSIGGPEQSSISFSYMANHIANRSKFVDSALEYVRRFDVDGIDLYWTYPGDSPARPDKDNLIVLLKEMRIALTALTSSTGREYELTLAFGCTKDVIDAGYNVTQFSLHVDHFHLMCFGFQGESQTLPNPKISHNSPLYWKEGTGCRDGGDSPEDRQLTVEFGVNYFLQLGTRPEKLVLGISAAANTYSLGLGEYHNFCDMTMELGPQQPYTNQAGFSSFYEMCLKVKVNNEQWEFRYDYDNRVPYVFNPNDNTLLWFGFENEVSAQEKVDFAMSKGLGGMMMHFIDLDDCKNLCGGWFGECPLTASIKDRLAFWNRKNNV